ncbi:MAG: SGNH/GDSL hydrolase family protein [Nitrospirae bacterium]|nr:MAG: SGNH/GDSL hydrolase family protein [Nitrospirota bacterium]
MREFYSQAAVDFRRLGSDEFHDLTDVFDHYPEGTVIYIDQVHCSDKGYDLMAQRMAKDILKQEGRVAGCGSERPALFSEPAQAKVPREAR